MSNHKQPNWCKLMPCLGLSALFLQHDTGLMIIYINSTLFLHRMYHCADLPIRIICLPIKIRRAVNIPTKYMALIIIKQSILLHLLLDPFVFLLVAQANSISFEFNNLNFPREIKQLKLEGDASLLGNILQLTKEDAEFHPTPNSVGRASFHSPILLWNANTKKLAHFTTEFIFTLEPIHPSAFGDGLAFFLAPFDSSLPPHSAGGSLGLVNPSKGAKNHIVAVEFDRFVNEWDPRSGSHIGIDVNSVVSTKTLDWDLANRAEIAARALITYDSDKKELSLVVTDPIGRDVSARFSYSIDLRDFLPESVRVGFSASTGGMVERHNIQFWNFTSTLPEK